MPTPWGTPLTRCVPVGCPPVEPSPVNCVPVPVAAPGTGAPPGTVAPGAAPGRPPVGATLLPFVGMPSPWLPAPPLLLPSPCTVDPQPASSMTAAVAAIAGLTRCSFISCSDRVRHSGSQPATEVHTGDATVVVTGEVTAHSLCRPVRDDVLVAVAGDDGEGEHRLLLRHVLPLFAQCGSHLGFHRDAGRKTAAFDSDVDRGGDRLERSGELGESVFAEGQLLGLDVDDAQVVLQGPLLQLVVDLVTIGPAVGHRDVGEAPLGHEREVGVLTVRRTAVADQSHSGDVLEQPADADEVTKSAALHRCRRLLHELEQLL